MMFQAELDGMRRLAALLAYARRATASALLRGSNSGDALELGNRGAAASLLHVHVDADAITAVFSSAPQAVMPGQQL